MISENIPMCELIDMSVMSEGYGCAQFTAEDFIQTHGERGILLAPLVKVKQKTTPYP